MSTFTEVVNPISGLGTDDIAEITVRRNNGSDKSIEWNEANTEWVIRDNSRVAGDLFFTSGQISKSSDFTVTSDMLNKTVKVQTDNSSSQIDITLPNGLDGGFHVNIVNDGSGIIRFQANGTLDTEKNGLLEKGRVTVEHIGSDVWTFEGGGDVVPTVEWTGSGSEGGQPATAPEYNRLFIGDDLVELDSGNIIIENITNSTSAGVVTYHPPTRSFFALSQNANEVKVVNASNDTVESTIDLSPYVSQAKYARLLWNSINDEIIYPIEGNLLIIDPYTESITTKSSTLTLDDGSVLGNELAIDRREIFVNDSGGIEVFDAKTYEIKRTNTSLTSRAPTVTYYEVNDLIYYGSSTGDILALEPDTLEEVRSFTVSADVYGITFANGLGFYAPGASYLGVFDPVNHEVIGQISHSVSGDDVIYESQTDQVVFGGFGDNYLTFSGTNFQPFESDKQKRELNKLDVSRQIIKSSDFDVQDHQAESEYKVQTSSGSTTTVTLPDGLSEGWSAKVSNDGDGTVDFVTEPDSISNATIKATTPNPKLVENGAEAKITYSDNTFYISGQIPSGTGTEGEVQFNTNGGLSSSSNFTWNTTQFGSGNAVYVDQGSDGVGELSTDLDLYAFLQKGSNAGPYVSSNYSDGTLDNPSFSSSSPPAFLTLYSGDYVNGSYLYSGGIRFLSTSNRDNSSGISEQEVGIFAETDTQIYNASNPKLKVTANDGTEIWNKLVLNDNNASNTSGDIQIRDDSNGDLFSLDDGTDPKLTAKYEGSGAFTFGVRNGVVGTNSVVVNGSNNNSVNVNEASGDYSFSQGYGTTASGRQAFAEGNGTTASNNQTHAEGYETTASGNTAHAEGWNTTASGDISHSGGYNTISRSYSSVVIGLWNKDYLGSGNSKNALSSLTDNDRIFAVGVGDDPNSSPGDTVYFDGRGRTDGLYVTYRDGTHIRHGLSVDGYNASLGQYKTNFEINSSGYVQVADDIEITEPGSGTILTSPDGTRFRVHVENDGTIVSTELP